jgi:hypothetical protein
MIFALRISSLNAIKIQNHCEINVNKIRAGTNQSRISGWPKSTWFESVITKKVFWSEDQDQDQTHDSDLANHNYALNAGLLVSPRVCEPSAERGFGAPNRNEWTRSHAKPKSTTDDCECSLMFALSILLLKLDFPYVTQVLKVNKIYYVIFCSLLSLNFALWSAQGIIN